MPSTPCWTRYGGLLFLLSHVPSPRLTTWTSVNHPPPTPALCWSPSLGYHWQTPPRASLSSMFPRPPVASRAIMSLDDVGCILAGYLIVILLVAMSGANNSAWFTAQGCPLPPSLQVP